MTNLDLYCKIEPILGIKEAAYKLYSIFLNEIDDLNLNGNKVLDFGCGNGEFAKILQDNFEVIGLDKSCEMVKKSNENGVIAYSKKLCEFKDNFDLITAVSDVVNYMNDDELSEFLNDSYRSLNIGGYLVFDINTEFGFSGVANGVLHERDGDNHLIIDAKFDGKKLETFMIYFEKYGNIFNKIDDKIIQYYHNESRFKDISNFKLIKQIDVNLYSEDVADKVIFILQKIK